MLIGSILLLFVSELFAQPLKVAIAGLSHDHVNGVMRQYKNREVIILGIAEADEQLVQRYKKTFGLPDALFFKSIGDMLKKVKPDAVLAYNAVVDHLAVVEAAAPLGLSVMVEKSSATTVKQTIRMAQLVNQYHIQLLTNYETTWYSSNQRV